MASNLNSTKTPARPARGPQMTATDGARRISADKLDGIFSSVGQKLREGLSGEAEKILTKTIADFVHTPDDLANLKRLLSFTLETAGRYKESLEAVRPFEDEENLANLTLETQIRVTTHLAIAYNNL